MLVAGRSGAAAPLRVNVAVTAWSAFITRTHV